MDRHRTVRRKCNQCGRDYQARCGLLGKGKSLFCSHACSVKWRTGKRDLGKLKTSRVRAAARFRERVQKGEGCWLWQGKTDKDGYGILMVECRKMRAHRFAYELENGPIQSGLHVCHRCDTPACVRPDHLFLGTNADNLADMRRKGRDNPPRGERHRKHILTEKLVAAIRLLGRKMGYRRISHQLGVSRGAVRDVLTGATWKHVRLLTAPAIEE